MARSSRLKMRAWPLAVVVVVFWTQCLLEEVDSRKERKKPKEVPPQHTEVYNTTASNSEEATGSTKVTMPPPPIPLFAIHPILSAFLLLHTQGPHYEEMVKMCAHLVIVMCWFGFFIRAV